MENQPIGLGHTGRSHKVDQVITERKTERPQEDKILLM